MRLRIPFYRKGEISLAIVVTVTSGKGGVGKTTSSAAFAAGLAQAGHKTVVIDFDVGLRNLDLIMGVERRVVFDFVNVIQGEATLNQALIQDKRIENLSILAASQTKDKDALSEEGVETVIQALSDMGFEYIVCDSPAGIERGATMALHFADHAIIVTNPEVSSVRDSDRILGILQSKSKRAKAGDRVTEHLLITRYDPIRVEQGEMLSHEDVCDILAVDLMGVIPESKAVLKASNTGVPVIFDQESDAGVAYADAVARFLGETRPMKFLTPKKQGFLKRMLGGND
jgi:septum site-determining protein MinD